MTEEEWKKIMEEYRKELREKENKREDYWKEYICDWLDTYTDDKDVEEYKKYGYKLELMSEEQIDEIRDNVYDDLMNCDSMWDEIDYRVRHYIEYELKNILVYAEDDF